MTHAYALSHSPRARKADRPTGRPTDFCYYSLARPITIRDNLVAMYELRYKKAAIKGLRKMPPKQRQRMVEALHLIADGRATTGLDVRPLTQRDGHRLRIGQWRAIYQVRESELILLVLDIGPRGDIYK